MLTDNDSSGIFTFMIGVIVVVMTAIGLSLVVDKRFKFSKGAIGIQREIALDASEIAELNARHDDRSRELSVEGIRLRSACQTYQGIAAGLENLRQRQPTLEKSRAQAGESINALEENFSRYRAEYVRKIRTGAIGESHGTLTVRGGRAYHEATITRVTDVGLEIRHEHGIARIQAPDLDPKMQDRFQWSDEERRSRLKEELENLLGKSDKDDPGIIVDAVAEEMVDPPTPQVIRIQNPIADGDAEKSRLLRLKVIGWSANVNKLRMDRREASSRASYGNQTSVPGSLETWVARSARLGRDLLRAQAALAVAKSELAAVAPDDPLLKPLETDP